MTMFNQQGQRVRQQINVPSNSEELRKCQADAAALRLELEELEVCQIAWRPGDNEEDNPGTRITSVLDSTTAGKDLLDKLVELELEVIVLKSKLNSSHEQMKTVVHEDPDSRNMDWLKDEASGS